MTGLATMYVMTGQYLPINEISLERERLREMERDRQTDTEEGESKRARGDLKK